MDIDTDIDIDRYLLSLINIFFVFLSWFLVTIGLRRRLLYRQS